MKRKNTTPKSKTKKHRKNMLPREQQLQTVAEIGATRKYQKGDGGIDWKVALMDHPELREQLGMDPNTNNGGMQRLYQLASNARAKGLLGNQTGRQAHGRAQPRATLAGATGAAGAALPQRRVKQTAAQRREHSRQYAAAWRDRKKREQEQNGQAAREPVGDIRTRIEQGSNLPPTRDELLAVIRVLQHHGLGHCPKCQFNLADWTVTRGLMLKASAQGLDVNRLLQEFLETDAMVTREAEHGG
jgi:hypothetical protein